MNKLKFTISILLISMASALFAQEQPNIVLLFVDDLGWADLGYRNETFETPHIDDLQKESMDFSRAYVSTATCSPSRASILTGKEPVRFEMTRHIYHQKEYADKDGRTYEEYQNFEKDPSHTACRSQLPLKEVTYAELLKKQGYYNMFIGKWHLGHEEFHPIHQGFDAQLGTSNFGHPGNYYAPFFKQNNPMADAKEGTYLTDQLTTYAEDFLDNYDKKKPFMMSLWYYTVHGPHIGRKDLVEKYKAKGLEPRYAQYAAMVSVLDESVGRVRAALKRNGMDENTLIIFTSDQGGYFTNAPLRGGKIGGQTLCEGGSRVPFMMYYPPLIKEGVVSDVPVQTIDVLPTVVELASGKAYKNKKIQGKSLMPLMRGEEMNKRALYFRRSYEDQHSAMIRGNFKLIKYYSGKYELFNVKNDIGEANNLVEKKPEMVESMKVQMTKWEKSVAADVAAQKE